MREVHTSLLREKFVLHDPNIDMSDTKPIVALSNRMEIELRDDAGKLVETFVIRSQNMHSCVRMVARLIQSFEKGGPILKRAVKYDWETTWSAIVSDYEQIYNEERWICIYSNGKVIFADGQRHPLLDLVEKCDAMNKGPYEDSIPMAEDAFKKTGKVFKIEYDGNVALVVNLEEMEGRCGIILRGAERTTTFNFTATAKPKMPLEFTQCLSVAAGFLEGIQMSFMIGMGNAKLKLEIIEKNTEEERQHKEAIRRLKRLEAEITNFENMVSVRYRPEHPSFNHIVMDAEERAMAFLRS